MEYFRHNQKGSVHLLLLLSALALIAFILFSASAGFKDKLFASLFPKQLSIASEGVGSVKFVDENSNQITQVPSTTVKVQISDVTWSPQTVANRASPVPVTTVNVLLAEDLNFTVNTQSVGVGTTYYNFSDSTPGTKTLYTKFIGSDGTKQNANPFPAVIQLISPTPTPSPTSTDSPANTPTPAPTNSPTPAPSPSLSPSSTPTNTPIPTSMPTPSPVRSIVIYESAENPFPTSQPTLIDVKVQENKDCGLYCNLDKLLKKISPSTEEKINSFLLSILIKFGLIKE